MIKMKEKIIRVPLLYLSPYNLKEADETSTFYINLDLHPYPFFEGYIGTSFGGDMIVYYGGNSLRELLQTIEEEYYGAQFDLNDENKTIFVKEKYTSGKTSFLERILSKRETNYELFHFKDEENKSNDYTVSFDSKSGLFVAKRKKTEDYITAKTMYDIKEEILKRQTETRIIPSDKEIKEGLLGKINSITLIRRTL